MSNLSELRERVEGASRPDRELDAHIAAATGLPMHFCDFEAGSYHGGCVAPGCGKPLGLSDERRSYPGRWEDDERLPCYTASIDAALALVERKLPDFGIVLCIEETPPRLAHASMIGETIYKGRAPTLPLAILSALLRALESQEQDGG